MTTPFDEAYYSRTIDTFGYKALGLSDIERDLGGLGQQEARKRFLCHLDIDSFLTVPRERRTYITGIGMSGPPHAGTLVQMRNAIRFQAAAENVTVVLGDLDAYNGKNKPYEEVSSTADDYRAFLEGLGFSGAAGTCRHQRDSLDELRTMYLSARFVEDADFDDVEEDNHAYYSSLGIVDSHMTLARKLSLLLMSADFLQAGQLYDGVAVSLGIDEHRYVRYSQNLKTRLTPESSLRGTFDFAALYTRMTPGYGGHPKMSKSIPGSGISLSMKPDEIVGLVVSDDLVSADSSPNLSLILQYGLAEDMSREELLRRYPREGSLRRGLRDELLEVLVHAARVWTSV